MSAALRFEDRLVLAEAGLIKTASDAGLNDPTATLGVESVPHEEKETTGRPPPRPPVSINLFQHPTAHPLILDLALLKKYGPDWLFWEPETLLWRVPQDFRTSTISDLNLGKIQAIKVLHYVDDFWRQWEVFNWCTAPFNNLYADFQSMQVPSTAQMCVAIDIANRVRTDVPWELEVKGFIANACKFEGVFFPPDILRFAAVKPDNDLVDLDKISEEWPKVMYSDQMPTADTIVAEQLRRTLGAHRFLKASQERLVSQLPMLRNA